MVHSALKTFEALGATVDWVDLLHEEEARAVTATMVAFEAAQVHRRWLRDRPGDYGDDVRARLEAGLEVSGSRYRTAKRERRRLASEMLAAQRPFDAVIGPTVPVTAPRIADCGPDQAPAAQAALLANTYCFNVTGQPAVSIPCGTASDGLPVGLQMAAALGKDRDVLALAMTVQDATGWRPPASAEGAGHMSTSRPTSSHWGPLRTRMGDGGLTVDPHELDPDPSSLLRNMAPANGHTARIRHPMVRRGWLENGPGPSRARGHDEFVRVEWPELTALLAAELERVIDLHGNAAIFGGSYGWGSAGRFHHPQSQVHRFLNTVGGYARSVNTYSTGASSVILPYVLGPDVDAIHGLTGWSVLAEHTTLIVAFGGLPAKNMQVAPGGITRHRGAAALRRIVDGGATVVAVSPSRADCPEEPTSTGVRSIPAPTSR